MMHPDVIMCDVYYINYNGMWFTSSYQMYL